MKKKILVVLTVLGLMLGSSVPGHADRGGGHGGGYGGEGWHGGGGGHEGWGGGGHGYGGGYGGGGFGVDFGPSAFYGPAWDQYPYPVYAPPTVQSEPDQYVAPQPQERQYWYYCRNPKGYYPYVPQCQESWMKVVPSPAPAGPEVNQ